MSLLTRVIIAGTLLIGLAAVAVSAYAARSDFAGYIASPASDDGRAEGEHGANEEAAVPAHGDGDAADAVRDSGGDAGPPTPTAVLRYPVPDGAIGVGPGSSIGGGRGDLSTNVRVWPVLSLRPGSITVSALGSGGLDIPVDQLAVMLQVSQETSLPWQLFAAIAKVESDLGRNMSTSWAGAIGYGQFLPSSWETFGEGGDPYDFRDAIPAMGRFLLDAGADVDVRQAIYTYNHSWPYVAQVLSFAATYGYPNSVLDLEAGATNNLIWPVVGPISSYFSAAHPLGIDIDQTMAPGTPVLAAHDGVVLFAGGDPCCSYGRYVILVAPSGITTLYAHLSQLAVSSGQSVRQGEPLGVVGNTGYSTGTHLHFELIAGGVRRNPLDYLP